MQDKNAKDPRPYNVQGIQKLDEDEFFVASATECTGMIPAAPDSAAEVESYGEIYDVPLSRHGEIGNSANSGEPGIPGRNKKQPPSSSRF